MTSIRTYGVQLLRLSLYYGVGVAVRRASLSTPYPLKMSRREYGREGIIIAFQVEDVAAIWWIVPVAPGHVGSDRS
jgi:hypothetical protein